MECEFNVGMYDYLFVYFIFVFLLNLVTRRIGCDWNMYVTCDAPYCSTVLCCVQMIEEHRNIHPWK